MKKKETGDSIFPDQFIDEIDEQLKHLYADGTTENYFTPVLEEAINCIDQPKVVVDVGCGNGAFSAIMKYLCDCELIGIDGNMHALSKARVLGFDRVLHIQDFSKDSLPLDSEKIDFVICKDVLEHLFLPRHLLQELNRILIPGGYCMLHVPNHFPIIGRLRFLFSNNIDTFDYFPNAENWDFPHIRFFNKTGLVSLSNLCGFEVLKDLSWHFVRPAILKGLLRIKGRSIVSRFSDALCEGTTLLLRKK